jgi:hypothetical protein
MTDWKAVIDDGLRLPEGVSQQAAVDELAEMLRDRDPVVRDELAYTVLECLIPELDEDLCRRLGDELASRFTAPELHVRSFAALVLAPIVKRGVFRADWLDAFEAWYPSEWDLRGYDDEAGWLHAAAHGADLLGAFGLHDQVLPARMLAVAADRLVEPTDFVFAEMEDARLAHGIALTLTRAELKEDDAVAWLDVIEDELGADEAEHVLPQFANTIRSLQALYVFADRGVRRTWDREEAIVPLTNGEAVKARIGEVLRLVMPYAG